MKKMKINTNPIEVIGKPEEGKENFLSWTDFAIKDRENVKSIRLVIEAGELAFLEMEEYGSYESKRLKNGVMVQTGTRKTIYPVKETFIKTGKPFRIDQNVSGVPITPQGQEELYRKHKATWKPEPKPENETRVYEKCGASRLFSFGEGLRGGITKAECNLNKGHKGPHRKIWNIGYDEDMQDVVMYEWED